MARNILYNDVLPFTAMLAVECSNVGMNTLVKAATETGMSHFVLITYSYAIGTIILLPFPFIVQRTGLPPLKLPILWRLFLLGVLGFVARVSAYKGIQFSSPTLASAISNLTPAFTFILAIIFRFEKVVLRSSSSLAKIIGTAVSISGALVVVLYKGPILLSSSTFLHLSLSSSQTDWILGGFLISIETFNFSLWYIIQTQVMEMYPATLVLVFFYNLCATIISVPICLLAEQDLSKWRIQPDIKLITTVYTGFFGVCFAPIVHTWGVHLKGPLYVSIFKPFSIAIAVAMGITFLADSLYLGSVVGSVILCVGFYAVLWGKAKEEVTSCDSEVVGSKQPSSDQKLPLLGAPSNAWQ